MGNIAEGILAFEDGNRLSGTCIWGQGDTGGRGLFQYQHDGLSGNFNGSLVFFANCDYDSSPSGNYGVNAADVESDGPKLRGFVVREVSPITSNWRSSQSIQAYLSDAGIPGLEGLDTRAITKKLRLTVP